MSLTEQQDKVHSLERDFDARRDALRDDEDRYVCTLADRWWGRWPWGFTFIAAIVTFFALGNKNFLVGAVTVVVLAVVVVWYDVIGKREVARRRIRRQAFLDVCHEFALEQMDFDTNVRDALRERYGVTLPSRAVNAKTYTVQTPQGAARIWYDAGAPGRLLLGDVELPTIGGGVSEELRRAHKIADRARVSSILFAPAERVAIIALDDEVQRLRAVVNGTQRPEEKA